MRFCLCSRSLLTVMTVSVSAMMDKAAEQTPAPIAADTGAAGKTDMTFGERLAEAGQVTLLGMGMVFAVLALLWGVLELFRVIMQKSKRRNRLRNRLFRKNPCLHRLR